MRALVGLAAAAAVAAADPYYPAFHPRPPMNWMNDPNGPSWWNGTYFLGAQYNPDGPNWGNMSWAHMASIDLVHWAHLPVALYNDQPYDVGGVFSGSISVVQGEPVISYTCVAADGTERQCFARPANASDPLLVRWVKDAANPAIQPPPTIAGSNFRDPTTGWYSEDEQAWLMGVGGSVNGGADAAVLLFSSPDLSATSWAPAGTLFTQPGFGMAECPDFFEVAPGIFVLKMSTAGQDWARLGQYDTTARAFTPLPGPSGRPALYDPGRWYASKSFYDPPGQRRVLWGWVAEEGPQAAWDARGWASLQSLPRAITLNPAYGLLDIAPIPELAQLRQGVAGSFAGASLALANGVTASEPLLSGAAAAVSTQLEVEATFVLPPSIPLVPTAQSGAFALDLPAGASISFGVTVLSDGGGVGTRVTLTFTGANSSAVSDDTDQPGGDYWDFASDPAGSEEANVAACAAACAEDPQCSAWTYVRPGYPGPAEWPWSPRCSLKQTAPTPVPGAACCVSGAKPRGQLLIDRSSSSSSGDTSSPGGPTWLLSGQGELQLRVFVDHSVVEAFVDGGRARVTSRVYPANPAALPSVQVWASAEGLGPNPLPPLTVNATAWPLGSIWTTEAELRAKIAESAGRAAGKP